MPIVRVHPEECRNLLTEYDSTAADLRTSVSAISPLITEALGLLDQPGQHPLYGPMPALTTVANDLAEDARDLEWRVDLITSHDGSGFDGFGTVGAYLPADLGAAFDELGLTDDQAITARQLMRSGATFAEAVQAATAADPKLLLDALRLHELNEAIDNWNGTDNDPLLDALVKERNQLRLALAHADPTAVDIDPDVLAIAARHGVTYGEAAFSIAVADIDNLTDAIDNWSGTDNDPILDELIEERNERVKALTENDPELAALFTSSLGEGKTAAEAATIVMEHVSHEARIDQVVAETGLGRDEAEQRIAHIDTEFEVLVAQGLEGAELETATAVLVSATLQGVDFDEIALIAQTQNVGYDEAAQIFSNAEVYGLSGAELVALQGFHEHFETFDTAAPPPPVHYTGAVMAAPANGKVSLGNLRYVVDNPELYTAAAVAAAQALLAQPQLLARIDTGKDNNDLFANEDGFGRTEADDNVYSLDDLAMFDAKQLAFAQLNPLKDDIDVAYLGGDVDGHLSKSDYEAFLSDNRADLSPNEVQALEIVINGDLYDQTWWEENKNSLAMASALVAAGAFTIATAGTGSVLVAALIAGSAAAGTTAAINISSDNLDWHEDLAGNTFNGALIGLGVASAPGSLTALRTGVTPGARILGATEITAEITGTIALGTFDPLLRPVIGEDNLDDTKAVTGGVSAVTGIGALGANGVQWARIRAGNNAIPEGTLRIKDNGAVEFVDSNGNVFDDIHLSPHDHTPFIYGDPPNAISRAVDATEIQNEIAGDLGLDARWVDPDGRIRWVDKPGTTGDEFVTHLEAGTTIDRYGVKAEPKGGFLSPATEPLTGRAIPPSQTYRHQFEVVSPHPLPVREGVVKPWFDDPGGATQYRLDADLIVDTYGPHGTQPVSKDEFAQMIDGDGRVDFEYWFGFEG